MAKLMNIQCPHGHVVAIDVKHVGRKVRCPICDVVMMVPRMTVAAPVIAPLVGQSAVMPLASGSDDVAGTEVDREAVITERLAITQLYKAFQVYIARLYVIVIAALAFGGYVAYLAFVAGANNPPVRRAMEAEPKVSIGLAILTWLVILSVIVLEIVAIVFASSTPERSKARPTFWTYVILTIVNYLASIIALVMKANGIGWGILVTQLIGFATFVYFILYLKTLAVYLDRDELASKAKGLLILFAVMMAGFVAMMLPSIIAGEGNRRNEGGDLAILALVGGLVTGVAGIWMILRYVRLLVAMRDELKKRAQAGTSAA